MSPPMEVISLKKKFDKINSPPKTSAGLPIKKEILSPPKKEVPSPPVRNLSRISSFQKQNSSFDSNKDLNSPAAVESPVLNKNSLPNLQNKDITSPPVTNKLSSSPPVNNREVTSPPFTNKVVTSPPGNKVATSPPVNKSVTSPPVNNKGFTTPPIKNKGVTPPVNKGVTSPPVNNKGVTSPPVISKMASSSPVSNKGISSPPVVNKGIASPLFNSFKFNKIDPKLENDSKDKKGPIVTKETPVKTDKLSLPANNDVTNNVDQDLNTIDVEKCESKEIEKGEETNGVGDKIRKFEKAAEDASASSGRLSRPGSVRGRTRTERIGSDSKEDLPPPATPFKDHVFFDNGEKSTPEPIQKNVTLERQNSVNKTASLTSKWQRNESSSTEEKVQKPEPQKIIKPEFKPMPSPVDLTIRSPSLGTKLPDQFPSQGTAFRNVASPDTARSNIHKFNEDNNLKVCKLKNKEKYSVSKGSSYFTRGSEEIWLVKKKDIEEIEERVLDSFRRAGGNICMRSESMRPSSDSGQSVSFPHATMGRNKRSMYTRSESLDPQWAGARAQTLKRQSSVACTCGHDKKTRSKSATSDTPRLRSRSHGDENNQGHVLDKYETLV